MMVSSGVPAVFLDRDGVIVEDRGHLHREDQLAFIPGAADAIRRLNRTGYLVIVVTDQPGIALGLFSEGEMHGFNSLMVRRLAAREARIGAVYCCPYHPEARDPAWAHPDHPERKPNPGLILKAISERGVDPRRSFLIGASADSLEAANRAGVPGFLFEGGDLDRFTHELLGG